MKNKKLYNYIGKVMIGLSILFVFPILVAIIYREPFICFIIPQMISLSLGLLLNLVKYKKTDSIYAKDGLKIVALSWIIISIIGALPIFLNKDASYIDAVFETVSGFTTTGATIFKDVEILNKSILFWRSFTHFIGGMGVLAFVMAIIPLSRNDKSMHVLKAEMPGPNVSKLVPGIKKTLAYLYGIYIFLTIIEIILLKIGGLSFFDSLLISMGTAGTGGFSVLNSSIASYSIFSKYVVAIFMFLFGVNFNIYFLIIMKDLKSVLKSEELRAYILIFIFSVFIIFIDTFPIIRDVKQTFMEAVFHISSIFTSTGYSIGNVNIYPTTSRVICLVLMIISACAGSTCGGMKISRIIISMKSIKRDLTKMIHPNSVEIIKFEGKKVSEETVKNTNTFIQMYIVLILIIIFIVALDKFSLETTINAVFCTFANVGLCFNISNFANFSNLSKLVLSFGMLCGRLELFPMIALFSNRKKN